MAFSMLRQEFVIIIFLGLWPFIKDRKVIFPAIVLYLCSFIHSSALILVPFAFWGFFPIKNGRIVALSYLVLLLALWLSKNFLNDIFSFVLIANDTFDEYANNYGGVANDRIGIGFIINMIPFILSILYIYSKNNLDNDKKRLVALASITFLIMPFGNIVPLIGRVGVYFSIYNLCAIPLIYENIKITYLRFGFLFLYVLILFYDYFRFFGDPLWIAKYSTFHTIFSII